MNGAVWIDKIVITVVYHVFQFIISLQFTWTWLFNLVTDGFSMKLLKFLYHMSV